MLPPQRALSLAALLASGLWGCSDTSASHVAHTDAAPPLAPPPPSTLPAAPSPTASLAPSDSLISLSPPLCAEACANALKLTLAELPTDAVDMRSAISDAMSRDCARRCLERASLESARCIAAAKSALELARCP